MRDLVVLVADKDAEAALKGLFSRSRDIPTRVIEYDLHVHPHRDPGCRLEAQSFLRQFLRTHTHALVLFDREGCGHEHRYTRLELERQVEGQLMVNGWNDRAAVVVLDPELEVWVWTDSPRVDEALGWQRKDPALRHWLRERGELQPDQQKPPRPKEAVEIALRQARLPRSSSIYFQLAMSLPFGRCTDPAFLRLRDLLRRWFAP